MDVGHGGRWSKKGNDSLLKTVLLRPRLWEGGGSVLLRNNGDNGLSGMLNSPHL